MRIVEGSAAFDAPAAISLTIGNFDGVHLGHRELLRRTVMHARDAGIPSAALTFRPHPVRYFMPSARFYEITQPAEKARLLAEAGLDILVVEEFGAGIGGMEPVEFAREIIAARLHAKFVTVGYDFTFGLRRTGSPEILVRAGRDLGFMVDVVPPRMRGGAIVSSTRIRDLILAGRVREAGELLCRPYALSGPVVEGTARGRGLGFPTANVAATQDLVPLPGVYLAEAEVDGVARRAVANIGFNPTFGENSLTVEVHILGFLGDLYGKILTVRFRDRIRDERKFKSAEELVRQIRKDVAYAKDAALPGIPASSGGREAEGKP